MDAFFWLAAIGALGVLGYRLLHSHHSKKWPTVEGRVVTAKILGEVESDGDGRKVEYFIAEIEYEYSVKGAKYVGSRLSHGANRFETYSDAIDALTGIAPRLPVTVYYNPDRPKESVLIPGAGSVAKSIRIELD